MPLFRVCKTRSDLGLTKAAMFHFDPWLLWTPQDTSVSWYLICVNSALLLEVPHRKSLAGRKGLPDMT